MIAIRHFVPLILFLNCFTDAIIFARFRRQTQPEKSQSSTFNAPIFSSFNSDQPLTAKDKENFDKVGAVANDFLERLGFTYEGREIRKKEPLPSTLYQSDDINGIINEANQNRIDLQGITSGQIPGLAPIPVPGYPGPSDIPTVPGVNTIPGLKNFNYVVLFISCLTLF